jgi:hypothetical protein
MPAASSIVAGVTMRNPECGYTNLQGYAVGRGLARTGCHANDERTEHCPAII